VEKAAWRNYVIALFTTANVTSVPTAQLDQWQEVIHKWRHAVLILFDYPSLLSHFFLRKASVLLSKNPWYPLPFKAAIE